MKSAKIAELRNDLSRFLAYVRHGGRVRVLDRDRPIAELVPVQAERARGTGPLNRIADDLERRGVLRRGSGVVPARILRGRLPRAKKSVLAALLEERRETQ